MYLPASTALCALTLSSSTLETQMNRTLAATAALIACTAAHAQSITPQQFVDACRNNPANTVLLTEPTKFQAASSSSTYTTPTGCTVVLGAGASFELDSITMTFGGGFTVQGGEKSKVALDKATLSARAVALNLTGREGEFQLNEARLAARAGNLSLQFGEKGKLEVKNSGGWYQPWLSAKGGRLSLTAGASFSGTVVGSGLQGAKGVTIAFNGFDSAMKVEKTDILVSSGATSPGPYIAGPLQVTGSAAKTSFELIDVNLMEASQAVQIALSGAESKIGLNKLTSATGSQRIAIGALGFKGEVKLQNPILYGSPDVVIESGALGTTTVVTSPGVIAATALVRIRAGTGGSCNAPTSGLSAPTIEVCQ